jgi:hypothetical protein
MASYWEETDDILQSRHLEERLNQMSKKCRNCQKCWGVLVCFNAFQKWKKKNRGFAVLACYRLENTEHSATLLQFPKKK